MTRTIYQLMDVVACGLWVLFGIGVLVAVVMWANDEGGTAITALLSAFGAMFAALILHALAAIGNDIALIREAYVSVDEEEEDETDEK